MEQNSRDWDTLLKPGEPWKSTYSLLAEDVRRLCLSLEPGQTLTTKGVRLALYPHPRHEPSHQRFYRALRALSTRTLADCCSQGAAVKRYGKDAFPLKWHAPDPSKAVAATPQALRSPEHAIVQRLSRIDWATHEVDPFAQMDDLLKIAHDACKLAKVA